MALEKIVSLLRLQSAEASRRFFENFRNYRGVSESL